MRELNVNEIKEVNGGVAVLLWTVLLIGKEGLNDFGRGLGSGLYDAIN